MSIDFHFATLEGKHGYVEEMAGLVKSIGTNLDARAGIIRPEHRSVTKNGNQFVDLTFDTYGAVSSGGFDQATQDLSENEINTLNEVNNLITNFEEPFELKIRVALRPGDEPADDFRQKCLASFPAKPHTASS